MRSQLGFASGRSAKRAGTLLVPIASFHACELTLLRFASSARPKRNPPGFRPRVGFDPRIGFGPRFGLGPRFGFGARSGPGPRFGFGARFGLGSRFGLGPRFGFAPRLGFCARILAISPAYGCRLPSSREAESPILNNLPIPRSKCHLYLGSV